MPMLAMMTKRKGKLMQKLKVTAVGRLLKPKGDEPHIEHVIRVRADGTVQTVVRRDYAGSRP